MVSKKNIIHSALYALLCSLFWDLYKTKNVILAIDQLNAQILVL